jgi:hypothetical protein
LLLLHVPLLASLNVAVALAHNDVVPAIGLIEPATVTVVVLMQPEASVYVTEELPTLTPVAIPVVDPTVAMLVLLLLHVPPAEASYKVVIPPAHTLPFPVIGSIALTVTAAVALHPPALGK